MITSLPSEVIKNFSKLVSGGMEPAQKTKTFVYGTVYKDGDETYLQLDGSTEQTYTDSVTQYSDGDRVIAVIEDHRAIITGNYTAPAVNEVYIQERIDEGDFQGEAGEDAVVLKIESSRGTLFKTNTVSTVLRVTIYSGPDRITDITELRTKYGNGAYLQWYWQRLDDSDYGIIVSSDEKLSENGFALTLTPDEVDTKVTFRCELIVP